MNFFTQLLEPLFLTKKASDKRRLIFCESRRMVSSEHFATSFQPDTKAISIALAVRESVASLAGVDARYIRVDDRFVEDIARLPFWRNPLGNLFTDALEKHGISISSAEARHLTNIDVVPNGFSVEDFVKEVVRVKNL